MDFNLESSTASMNVNLAQVFKQNNIEYIFEQPRHPQKLRFTHSVLRSYSHLKCRFFLHHYPVLSFQIKAYIH